MRKYNREYNKKWRKENGYHNEIKWKDNNQAKIKVHRKVRYACSVEKLKRPNHCEQCQKETEIIAHHPDYSKPLDVMWLCAACHSSQHSRGG